jgi:capsular exopolysaccharide synthesis family protein
MLLIKSQLQETKRQIGEEIQNIINSMHLNLNTLVEKENTTNSALNEQKNHVLDLKNDLITFNSLKHELEITKDLYLTVSKRVREAKLTEALETNNVKIIQQALIPSFPVPSRGAIKLVLGIIAGLGLGAGIAFVSDYLDRRFKSASDIERNLGIPLLGVIPHYKLGKRKDSQLITLLEPWSPASEAYRSIRTWIQLSAPKALQVLLVTSAVPHEGKSTTAANLAVTYAQLGRKVLLIDADLRRPTIHRIFNLGNRLGLTDILTGKAHWEETLQNTSIDNLKVLLAGPVLPNPTELLSTGQLSQLLHVLKGSFDTIICDSPVQLSIPDVAIIVPDMDGVLLIHCPSRVNKEEVLETKKLLERAGANIVGVVLNNINKKDQQHYYSYYHDYSYGAGNSKVSEVHNTQPYNSPISDTQNQRFITERVNESPLLQSFSNVKIEKTSKSHDLSITVNGISYIANHLNDDYLNKKNLLSINIAVNNGYDTDYLFSPSLTTLHVVDRTYYEMMYSYSSEMKFINYDNFSLPHNSKNSYGIDPYTSKVKNGLYKERYIKSKTSEDGILIFCIPKDANYYVLTYVNGETRIVVPFDGSL